MRRTLVNIRTIGAESHLRSAHLQNPQQWQSEKRWAQGSDGATAFRPNAPYMSSNVSAAQVLQTGLDGAQVLLLSLTSLRLRQRRIDAFEQWLQRSTGQRS